MIACTIKSNQWHIQCVTKRKTWLPKRGVLQGFYGLFFSTASVYGILSNGRLFVSIRQTILLMVNFAVQYPFKIFWLFKDDRRLVQNSHSLEIVSVPFIFSFTAMHIQFHICNHIVFPICFKNVCESFAICQNFLPPKFCIMYMRQREKPKVVCHTKEYHT